MTRCRSLAGWTVRPHSVVQTGIASSLIPKPHEGKTIPKEGARFHTTDRPFICDLWYVGIVFNGATLMVTYQYY
jgi:hypothetical protein